jgi:hypothetical protein
MSQLPFFPSCRKILIFPHPHDARITALHLKTHTDGDSAPSEYNLGEDQAEKVDGFNSDYCDLPRIRRRQKCHKKFHVLLKLTCLLPHVALSSKKKATDRPNLMLQATNNVNNKKTNHRWPASTRAPHPPQPQTKRNHNKKATKRRRRRTAAAAL